MISNHVDASLPSKETVKKRVYLLGLGFFLLFVAYSAAQLLQTSINKERGYACLFTIYFFFAASALTAPYLVGKYGTRALLPLAAIPYVLFVLSYVLPEAFSIPSCGGVGLGAGVLWSCQGTYLGQASVSLAAVSGMALTDATSYLNATFYTVFSASGVASNALAWIILLIIPNQNQALQLLIFILSIAGGCGVLVLSSLPPADQAGQSIIAPLSFCSSTRDVDGKDETTTPPVQEVDTRTIPSSDLADATNDIEAGNVEQADSEASKNFTTNTTNSATSEAPPPEANTRPPILYIFTFLKRERKAQLMAPVSFLAGASQGYFQGAWMANVLARTLGNQWVGLAGALWALSATFGSSLWGYAAKQPTFGRRKAFVVAFITAFLWIITFSFVNPISLEERTVEDENAKAPIILFIAFFVGIGIISFVDPIWQAMVPATLQTFFPKAPDAPCAMATVRLFSSLGFALQQVFSLILMESTGRACIAEQGIVLALIILLAAYSMRHLHKHVCPIDGALSKEK